MTVSIHVFSAVLVGEENWGFNCRTFQDQQRGNCILDSCDSSSFGGWDFAMVSASVHFSGKQDVVGGPPTPGRKISENLFAPLSKAGTMPGSGSLSILSHNGSAEHVLQRFKSAWRPVFPGEWQVGLAHWPKKFLEIRNAHLFPIPFRLYRVVLVNDLCPPSYPGLVWGRADLDCSEEGTDVPVIFGAKCCPTSGAFSTAMNRFGAWRTLGAYVTVLTKPQASTSCADCGLGG